MRLGTVDRRDGPANGIGTIGLSGRVAELRANGATSPALVAATRKAVLRREARYRRALAAADVVSAATAVVLGVAVLGADRLTLSLLAAAPLVVLVSKILGLYDRDEHLLHKTTLDEAPVIFQVATLYTLLIWLSEGVLVEGLFARDQILGIWALLFVLMMLGRVGARWLVRAITAPERCLIVGDASSAKEIERKLKLVRRVKARIVGRVPLRHHEVNGAAPPIIGELAALRQLVLEHRVHRVIVVAETSESDQILDTISQVKLLGVKVSVLPRLREVVGSSAATDDLDGLTLLGVHRYGLTKSSEVLKRAMDACGAALGVILLSPLLAGVAAAVWLTSAGPILFRQQRIGRDGSRFELLKFRTMVDGADALKPDLIELNEADGFFKIADDPRMTRIGSFLRRSCLDELPQLFNVLHGEMSLVGPRPLVPDEDQRIEGWQRNRLLLKPGMTGHWQIFGSSRIPMREMVTIDYLYGTNWSLWLDTKILLRTIPYVVRRAGL
jgi:exopolysaccharide biosynthesis polyprenyl glycosylphosphotransferase